MHGLRFSSSAGRRLAALAAPALGAMALVGALSSAHAGYNPPIHMANGVEYMSGGVDGDEAALMHNVEPRWPASFEFAVKDGQRETPAAKVVLSVRDAATGRAVLSEVVTGGPLMVARLEPGHYEVEATLGGRTLKQQVELLPWQPKRTLFVWPAGTDAGTHS